MNETMEVFRSSEIGITDILLFHKYENELELVTSDIGFHLKLNRNANNANLGSFEKNRLTALWT